MFLLLRGSIDFNASAPIQQSRATAEMHTESLLQDLGVSTDRHVLLSRRYLRVDYFQRIREQGHVSPSINPVTLHQSDIALSGWENMLTRPQEGLESTLGWDSYFDRQGLFRVHYDNRKRVRKIDRSPGAPAYIELPPDSLVATLDGILHGSFGYEGLGFELKEIQNPYSDWSAPEDRALDDAAAAQAYAELPTGGELQFTWRKGARFQTGPVHVQCRVEKSINTQDDTEQLLASLEGCEAFYFEGEQSTGDEEGSIWAVVAFFAGFFIIGGLVLIIAFRQLFRGEVIWFRGVIVLGLVALAWIVWRVLIMTPGFYRVLRSDVFLIEVITYLFMASIIGLFAALGYMAWDSLARKQRKQQLEITDAIWRGYIFTRETGGAILNGYMLAGVILGVTAVVLYAFNLVIYPSETAQFGYIEPASLFPAASIALSTTFSSFIVVVAFAGVLVNAVSERVEKLRWLLLICAPMLSLTFHAQGWFGQVAGGMVEQSVFYLLLSIPFILSIRYLGIVSAVVAWWSCSLLIELLPFWGSDSFEVSSVSWMLVTLLVAPLAGGFIMRFKADTVSELESFIPEYETRLARQLRYEQEIKMAKSTQLTLMPLSEPDVPNADIKGFFIPSLEVGGDYFDYQIEYDSYRRPKNIDLTVVDVSGKGMKAAINAIFTSGLLLARMRSDTPEEALTHVNPTLYAKTDKKTFVTCLAARFDMHTRRFAFTNAGNVHPILKRNGKSMYLKGTDPRFPLGMRDPVTYNLTTVQLKPGDFVLMYSDGLPEAKNRKGRFYGYGRVLQMVDKLDTDRYRSSVICDHIRKLILNYSDYELSDDIAVISLKVK